MKNSPLIPILVGVLLVSSVLSVVFAVGYTTFASRDLRRLQAQEASLRNHAAFVSALGVDLIAYSKKDAGLLPLLRDAGLINPGSETSSKAGTK